MDLYCIDKGTYGALGLFNKKVGPYGKRIGTVPPNTKIAYLIILSYRHQYEHIKIKTSLLEELKPTLENSFYMTDSYPYHAILLSTNEETARAHGEKWYIWAKEHNLHMALYEVQINAMYHEGIYCSAPVIVRHEPYDIRTLFPYQCVVS